MSDDLSDFFFEDDADRKVRMKVSVDNARARHADWDEKVFNHKWTDEQNEAINSFDVHNGDIAEHAYNLAREHEWKPATDEQLYADGDGEVTEIEEKLDPMSDEAIYGE